MKHLRMLLSLALVLCLLAPCALAADNNLNEPGTLPICKETVKLTIGLPMNSTIEDFETCYQTLQLEEKGNYDLTFEIFPSGTEYIQKINLMVLDGGKDLPDVLLGGFSPSQVYEWGLSGAIIPVNEYYDNCAGFIDDSLSTVPLKPHKYVTSPDGNMYGLFTLNMSLLNEHQNRMFVYKPWLDKLGLELPTTIDEFYDMLVAFRDKDPNGNGEADEIPYMVYNDNVSLRSRSLIDYLMTAFVYSSNSNNYLYIDEDRQLQAAYASEGWREGLRFLNKLYNEGLFSGLSFTMDLAQFKTVVAGDETRVGAMHGTVSAYFAGTDPRLTEYYVLPPLEGPAGRYTAYDPSMPSISMLITKNCENPEAAFRLGDLLCSREFSVMTRWGEKGVDWVEPGEGEVSMFKDLGYDALIKAVTPWGIVQNKWWAQTGPYIRDYTYGMGMVASSNPFDTQRKLAETLNEYIAHVDASKAIGRLVMTDEELAVFAEAWGNISAYVEEQFALFVLGEKDLDNDWGSYLAEFEYMDLPGLLAVSQAAFDRMQ